MSSEFKVKSKQNIPTILAHKKLQLYDNDVDDSKILLYHYYSVCYLANILHICQVHETSTQFCAIATVIGFFFFQRYASTTKILFFICFCFVFFFCCGHGHVEAPGPGLKPVPSSNLSHSGDNTESLTC